MSIRQRQNCVRGFNEDVEGWVESREGEEAAVECVRVVAPYRAHRADTAIAPLTTTHQPHLHAPASA